VAALACAGRPAAPPALCVLERGAGAAEPDAATWIALLLRGYDAATRRLTSPPLDCTGAQIRWEGPALRCDDARVATTVLADRPLAPADVVATRVSADATLVWIATTHYATGDAAGPVALVAGAGPRLRVVALGVLRAYRERARLRLESLGPTWVLVAEGELCPPGGEAACIRAARVVPLRGSRFEPVPLVGEDGRCLSPAWFDLARQEEGRSERGRERLELTSTMSFSGGPRSRLVVEEQVVVHDVSPGGELASARVLRRAQARREVRWERGRLVASGTPLWWRVSYGGE
jgi:hypothetical protein